MRAPLSVAVVGLQGVGERYVRALDRLPQTELRWLYDDDARCRRQASACHPGATVSSRLGDVLGDDELDAVVVAVPFGQRAAIARRALEQGKHVLVALPAVSDASELHELHALAEERGRILALESGVCFSPAVDRLKSMIDDGVLGEVLYVQGVRYGDGGLAADEDVLLSLGAAELALVMHLLDDEPVSVSAHGEAYLAPRAVDVASCHLSFASGVAVHLHLSAVEPHARRELTVVGSAATAILDDRLPDRPLTMLSKLTRSGEVARRASGRTRFAECLMPVLEPGDGHGPECASFVAAVRLGRLPAKAARRATALVGVVDAPAEPSHVDVELGPPGHSGTRPSPFPAVRFGWRPGGASAVDTRCARMGARDIRGAAALRERLSRRRRRARASSSSCRTRP
ncbi:MAG: Gfo/Idh/MocA family oxidoreductase [Thermoleophilia bacterium]